MSDLTQQEDKALAAFKKRLETFFQNNLIEMRLFGSRARGEGDEDSDVDVLVLMREAPMAVRGKVFEIAGDILVEFGIDISPLVMRREQFQDMKNRERLLALEIERDARPL